MNSLATVLSLPWRDSYPEVASRTAALLTGRNQAIDTAALVEMLYPMRSVEGAEGVAARKKLWHVLAVLARHDLAPFARRGEPKRSKFPLRGGGWRFVTVSPWLWADYGSPHSEVTPRCPACGQYVHPVKGEPINE